MYLVGMVNHTRSSLTSLQRRGNPARSAGSTLPDPPPSPTNSGGPTKRAKRKTRHSLFGSFLDLGGHRLFGRRRGRVRHAFSVVLSYHSTLRQPTASKTARVKRKGAERARTLPKRRLNVGGRDSDGRSTARSLRAPKNRRILRAYSRCSRARPS